LDQVLKLIKFKNVQGIKKCHILDNKKGNVTEYLLQLEGINFKDIYMSAKDLDLNRIYTNDIGSFLRLYGIEACRASIVKEINNVFDAYHISVDRRHLGLIADYITYQGTYRSFNRVGMETASSPFLKISFETSMNYLINSCMTKESDFGKNSSASIVLGQVNKFRFFFFFFLFINYLTI
jgi:DNA-directed RNA polymerase I subunit RPA1